MDISETCYKKHNERCRTKILVTLWQYNAMLNPDSVIEKCTALNYRCTKNSQCDKMHI